MNQVQEYLEQKRLEKMPKMWVVKSDPTGVELPKERTIINKKEKFSKVHCGDGRIYYNNRYYLDQSEFPFEIDIEEGKTSGKDSGYGFGVGDLWGWSYFCSLYQEEAEQYYQEELKRVTEKYLT